MLIFVLAFAVSARAQQKPFTQEQVQGLVRDGIGDATGAKLIAQRGIGFVLTDDFLQTLKSAGASEVFLQALRAAKGAQTASSGAAKPLSQIQIISLVAGEVPNHRVAILVQDRSIDFEPTDEFFRQLRLAGGDDELVTALKSAKVIKPAGVAPALQARQTEVRQHTARGAELLRKQQFAMPKLSIAPRFNWIPKTPTYTPAWDIP